MPPTSTPYMHNITKDMSSERVVFEARVHNVASVVGLCLPGELRVRHEPRQPPLVEET